jgi:predicted RNase H-like HicB family nuclease
MEKMLSLHIEKLPEGLYLATSDTLQGLVAQGRTIAETIEIAKDVANKLMDLRNRIPTDS